MSCDLESIMPWVFVIFWGIISVLNSARQKRAQQQEAEEEKRWAEQQHEAEQEWRAEEPRGVVEAEERPSPRERQGDARREALERMSLEAQQVLERLQQITSLPLEPEVVAEPERDAEPQEVVQPSPSFERVVDVPVREVVREEKWIEQVADEEAGLWDAVPSTAEGAVQSPPRQVETPVAAGLDLGPEALRDAVILHELLHLGSRRALRR